MSILNTLCLAGIKKTAGHTDGLEELVPVRESTADGCFQKSEV